MKAIRFCFAHMLLFIRRDHMLLAALAAPLLAGLFFKFAVPALETKAVEWTGAALLTPYYGLLDLFFSMLTPTMFCFAAAMVVLEEHDDHIQPYLFVTALGRKGYLISRICLPSAVAFLITLVFLPLFKLTALSAVEILLLSLLGALQGVIMALLICTISTNKLEGMAVTKVSTLIILGAVVPYFVPHSLQYVAFFLPSFWAGKAICDRQLAALLPSILLSLVWIALLLRRYLHKIS